MTPQQFRDGLEQVRWTQRGLADALGCDDRLVRRWAAGAASIPPEVATWLNALAMFHRQTPAPADWRRRAA